MTLILDHKLKTECNYNLNSVNVITERENERPSRGESPLALFSKSLASNSPNCSPKLE